MFKNSTMYFIFDLETTGLPIRGRNITYEHLEAFDSCRVVSIAWSLLDKDFNEVCNEYLVLRPDGYEIPESATAIHGISQNEAMTQGCDPEKVWAALKATLYLHPCEVLVSHNIAFDKSVLMSELYRMGSAASISLLTTFQHMKTFCTMREGQIVYGLKKFPKLAELYTLTCGKELQQAHNAKYDTMHCAECFVSLMNRISGVAAPGDAKSYA